MNRAACLLIHLLERVVILLVRGVTNRESVTLVAEAPDDLLALEVETEIVGGSFPAITCRKSKPS